MSVAQAQAQARVRSAVNGAAVRHADGERARKSLAVPTDGARSHRYGESTRAVRYPRQRGVVWTSSTCSSYLPGAGVNRDHEGGSPRARRCHCTSGAVDLCEYLKCRYLGRVIFDSRASVRAGPVLSPLIRDSLCEERVRVGGPSCVDRASRGEGLWSQTEASQIVAGEGRGGEGRRERGEGVGCRTGALQCSSQSVAVSR